MQDNGHIIAQLRAHNRMLRAQLADRDQETHGLRSENDVLRAKLAALEGLVDRMRRRLYGRSSERHHPGQQHIDLGMPVELNQDTPATVEPSNAITASAAERGVVAVESQSAAAQPAAGSNRTGQRRRPHPGRRPLPQDSEVIIEDVVVPDQERLDADGKPLPLLGWRITDKWDYRVGTYLIRRYRRAIYGRPFSEAGDRISAHMPVCMIPRGKMTDAAIVHTVVDKFADHLPLYRQENREARIGITLSRATLVGHVTAVAATMRPVYEAIVQRVRASPLVHLDDTPIKMLQPGRGRTATARIWVYRSLHETAFQFTESREGRHPAEFLGDYRGFIVADAYAGHERLYGLGRATAVGCWAHVRRKFHEILDREPLAELMVDDIRRLYAIEDEVRLVEDLHDRRQIRTARSSPLLNRIRQRLDVAQATILPESDLGKAVAYANARWPTLTRFVDNGLLPIDNNPAENALRSWAVGRKNWLFIGSPAGGERAAIVATLIENCRMHGLDPFGYLLDTSSALLHGKTDYHALTPWAVATAQQQRIA